MSRSGFASSLRKSYSSEPRKTLSFIDVDNNEEFSEITTHIERNKSKTEKSVHFADEEGSITEEASSLTNESLNESVASQTSQDIVTTWLPSEHLYSDDTFIQETDITATQQEQSHDQATSIQTVPSYGSSTFIPLDSDEDDTDTEQLYSYTDSFVSSDVFSTQSGTTYKEWKDVTEIVKDIEELEESEFVTKADSLELGDKDSDETEVSESLDEEATEAARLEFVTFALRRLRLNELQSPRSLATDVVMSDQDVIDSKTAVPRSREEKRFCRKMIQKCKNNLENKSSPVTSNLPVHPFYAAAEDQRKQKPLEFYGLNSALVERLKLGNLQQSLNKRSKDLDRDILKSETFVNTVKDNADLARTQFVSQMCAQVRRENMGDTIQAHLIKMHPVTKFAELVKDMPKPDEDVREILYQYKQQLEKRKAVS